MFVFHVIFFAVTSAFSQNNNHHENKQIQSRLKLIHSIYRVLAANVEQIYWSQTLDIQLQKKWITRSITYTLLGPTSLVPTARKGSLDTNQSDTRCHHILKPECQGCPNHRLPYCKLHHTPTSYITHRQPLQQTSSPSHFIATTPGHHGPPQFNSPGISQTILHNHSSSTNNHSIDHHTLLTTSLLLKTYPRQAFPASFRCKRI